MSIRFSLSNVKPATAVVWTASVISVLGGFAFSVIASQRGSAEVAGVAIAALCGGAVVAFVTTAIYGAVELPGKKKVSVFSTPD